ncbi:peroxisomal leader peptide-processing protease-like [Empidonax traillii]|uniref:peroxisomal leader peptide-processing protease-like n=1 Tax=Empidonax traillii TaxID=164674 RepID=UPI000FFD26DD|nr:peroxisomal leader peptide-processing protease-like [Empidonax traillii]
MLQTTCAVHGGSSGGPLLSSRSGCLMGIVASNTRNHGAGATYPHLNFCIPITVLQPLVARYRRTRDPGAFAGLNCAAQGVRAAWKLQRQPGPPQQALTPPSQGACAVDPRGQGARGWSCHGPSSLWGPSTWTPQSRWRVGTLGRGTPHSAFASC